MRAGLNWATQQTLTAEAALVLRHSLGLARRRRHAQLTPLHIAVALLSSSRPSLLTKACLQSRNRNLPPPAASIAYSMQCRAIELCFNVALNRLPTISSEYPVSNQSVPLSNALIAALKRAQANQRRGCIEGHQNQQEKQTFVNIKVGLGQLIISILDDPSVSRALREAGFSSIAVKDRIEEYYSISTASTSVPSEGYGLSPHGFRFHDLGIPLPPMKNHEAVEIPKPFSMLDCCEECISNYEREVHVLKSFPFGLQSISEVNPHKDEDLVEVWKKWAKLCSSVHRDKLNRRSSNYFASPGSKNAHRPFGLWADNHSPISFDDPARGPNHDDIRKNLRGEPNLDVLKRSEGKEVDVTLSLGNSNVCDKNKILGMEHLIMKLKENVPWQREKTEAIANTLLEVLDKSARRDAWIMLEGNDTVGKRRLGYAIGESLLGSADSVIYFNMRVRSYGLEDMYNELSRRKSTCGEEKLAVIMVENIDSAESHFVKFLEERFEAGKGGSSSVGMEKDDWQVVFILTKGDCCYKGGTSSVVHMLLKANESIHRKRKADWEVSIMIKKQRLGDNGSFIHTKAYFPGQQRSTNSIDLNVEADEAELEAEESSPIASNITQETDQSPRTFIETIENRFIFDQSPASDIEKKEILFSKLKRSFDEVYGIENQVGFIVDDPLLEELIHSSGFVSDCLMEKWVRDIFQTSLNIVRIRGRSDEVVRLCIGDGEKMNLGDGFFNSSLPNKINISFD